MNFSFFFVSFVNTKHYNDRDVIFHEVKQLESFITPQITLINMQLCFELKQETWMVYVSHRVSPFDHEPKTSFHR